MLYVIITMNNDNHLIQYNYTITHLKISNINGFKIILSSQVTHTTIEKEPKLEKIK